MTTLHDFSDGFRSTSAGRDVLTLDAFLAARAARRLDEADRLSSLRARFVQQIKDVETDHLQRAERLFNDPSLTQSERARLLAHHRVAMRDAVAGLRLERDATAERDHPTTGLGRWLRARAETNADRVDFVHVLKTSYEDGGLTLDPVLLAIPRARRHRENGMIVYRVLRGRSEREIFRVLADTNEVVMRATDEGSLEAAIVKAQHDFGPPLRFESHNAEFVARCKTIAARYGFAVAERPHTPPNGTPPSGPGSPRNNGAGAAASAADSPVSAQVPNIDLGDHAALCDLLRESHGVDYVAPLSPTSKLALSGRFLGAEPHPDNPNVYVVAIETANGAVLVAVERAAIDDVATETVLTLRGIEGKWQVACPTREAPQPSSDRPIDDQQRGR